MLLHPHQNIVRTHLAACVFQLGSPRSHKEEPYHYAPGDGCPRLAAQAAEVVCVGHARRVCGELESAL